MTKEIINSFLNVNSNVASNRMTYKYENGVKVEVPVRYLENNLTETYKSFPFKDQVSKSTLVKYLKKENIYKKPFRLTDLCDYCEWYSKSLSAIKNCIKKFEDFQIGEEFEIEKLIEYLERKLEFERANANDPDRMTFYNFLIHKLGKMETVLGHKSVKNIQRQAYNYQRKNIEYLNGKILIELDFKQKIMIGVSPRQVNKEFYKVELRTCLGKTYLKNNLLFKTNYINFSVGFGVVYLSNGAIKTINFDIISADEKFDYLETRIFSKKLIIKIILFGAIAEKVSGIQHCADTFLKN